MALAITDKVRVSTGNFKEVIATNAWDSSYPTDGEALSAADLGLTKIHFLEAEPAGGYTFQYDRTNAKLKAFSNMHVYTATVDPASLASDAIANETVTVTGVATTDRVIAIPPITLEAGLVVQSADVSSADTVRIRLQNLSAGTVNAASATWTFIVYTEKAREVKNATDLSGVTGQRIRAIGY